MRVALDTLSRLLQLHPVTVELDYHCHLRAPWRLEEPALGRGAAAFHLMVEGDAWLDLPGEPPLALAAGDIVVVSDGSAHALRADASAQAPLARPLTTSGNLLTVGTKGRGARCEILCGRFQFPVGESGLLFAALPRCMLIRGTGGVDLDGMRHLIGMLRNEVVSVRPGAAALVAQLAAALFALLLRAWVEQGDDTRGLFRLLVEPRLAPALKAMLTEPGKHWSLEQLAGVCHVSRASFARLFAQCAATTPAKLLTQLRMAQAAQWLAQDRRSIAAIAAAVGYQSEAAFNRSFKRCIGVGPGRYRRERRAPH